MGEKGFSTRSKKGKKAFLDNLKRIF